MLANIQGSCLPNSGVVHPNKEEIGKNYRRHVQVTKELLRKLRGKTEAYRGGRVDWCPERNTGKLCGNLGIRLGKVRPN